ncbi:TniB family NTP-binding protein [Candidatus Parabeggiatoa sp. HSG14]|uniref:TniB family NTP-binding protein n=1 Tax=Candidatus Parabeggiatoa sp. HSG14 TaxID=3055593 RepID=UPI0025A773D4|nr:TniB family NTP-binding protein [Thiotrichales bacterium HSG14]
MIRKKKHQLANPFVTSGHIEIGGPFVGRRDNLQHLIHNMIADQPTSINVIGNKNLGKSCLLYRFSKTWKNWIDEQKHSQYVVIYLSFGNERGTRENRFYQYIAEELAAQVDNNSELYQAMHIKQWNREKFNQALKRWKALKVLPVLCLDDFELLVKHRKTFDDDFYNNMRYLMGNHYLMLIVASRKQIKVYKKEYKLASSFFNDVHNLPLKDLNKEEVKELLATKDSMGEFALSVPEQRLARDWGKSHPRLLQLAGYCLFYARQSTQGVDWAKKEFNEQAQNVPRLADKWVEWLVQKAQALPKIGNFLGQLIRFIGNALTHIGAIFLLIVFIFALIGFVSWDSLKEMLPSFPAEITEWLNKK